MKNKIIMDMSLSALDVRDASNTYGGGFIEGLSPVIKKLTPAGIIFYIVDNWEDVKKGFSDGWNVR